MPVLTSRTIDDNTFEVTGTETTTTVSRYTLDFLLKQREMIVLQRDAELAAVDVLIAEAAKLGLVK